jgi:hypothetical protein
MEIAMQQVGIIKEFGALDQGFDLPSVGFEGRHLLASHLGALLNAGVENLQLLSRGRRASAARAYRNGAAAAAAAEGVEEGRGSAGSCSSNARKGA